MIEPAGAKAPGGEDPEMSADGVGQVDQAVLDAIPVPIFIKDGRGVYTACNRAYEDLLGISRAEFVGKTAHQIAPPELAAVYHAKDLELYRTGATQVYESLVVDRSGGERQVEFHKAVFAGHDGRTAGLLGVVHDVTERKQAEREIRASEERYRTLFEQANDAILIMRGEVFVDCNARTLATFGCTREQIVGATPSRLSPPVQPDGRDSAAESRSRIDRAHGGAPQFFEWRHCRLDGAPFDAEVSLSSIAVGRERLVQAIVRDVTLRKRAEDELKASVAANEALVAQLREALDNVKTLSGFLPICMYCHKIRDDQGFWERLENYITSHTGALLSHGLCPDCRARLR